MLGRWPRQRDGVSNVFTCLFSTPEQPGSSSVRMADVLVESGAQADELGAVLLQRTLKDWRGVEQWKILELWLGKRNNPVRR